MIAGGWFRRAQALLPPAVQAARVAAAGLRHRQRLLSSWLGRLRWRAVLGSFARERALVSARAQPLWIVGVTVAFALALCGMFQWMSWHARRTVIADTFSLSSNLALSVEQFVARTMETVDLTLRMVGAEAAEGGKSPREIQALLRERLRASPQITGLMVIGPDGRVRFSEGRAPKAAGDVAGARYFALTRNNLDIQVFVDGAVGRAPAGKRSILATRRLARGDGAFAGIVAATLSADYVQRFLSTLHVGRDGLIVLQTIDGTMLVQQPYQEDVVGQNFGATPLFQQWLPWASSGVFPMRYDSDGLWRIVGYQKVERLPLVVHVALSQDEALASWRRTTLWQAGVGTVILALAALTAFVLHRQLQARMRAHEQLSGTVRELERARIAAEESSRVKSHFMANMSHELRTPLNAVIGYSEILLEDATAEGGEPARVNDLRRINAAGQQLLGLVDDVLDISEIEVGRLELNEAPVDVVALVEDCRGLIAERVRSANLALRLELPPELPRLRGDERRLRQIVLNLLSNAVKFTPAGGRILLSVSGTPDDGIALAVGDTGIGMKPEEIPIALEPFRQVDGTINRRYEGTGLGLPLARTLTELHGGALVIDSAPGEGTTVTVTLPAGRVVRRAA